MENKKLTEEEMQKLKDFQLKQTNLLKELGQIGLAKLNLKTRQKNAKAFFINVKQEESTFLNELQHKYGIGSIDTIKGEFIPDFNHPTRK